MLDIAFEAFHIIGKGLYPLGCDPAKGSGLFPREPFFDLDVTGLGQFVELDAQVPCRGLGLFLDEVEIDKAMAKRVSGPESQRPALRGMQSRMLRIPQQLRTEFLIKTPVKEVEKPINSMMKSRIGMGRKMLMTAKLQLVQPKRIQTEPMAEARKVVAPSSVLRSRRQ